MIYAQRANDPVRCTRCAYIGRHDVRREITGGQWVVIEGHGLDRTLALAMAQTDFPRKMTESIADFPAPT